MKVILARFLCCIRVFVSDNMQIGNNFFFASLVGFRKCLPLVFVMACWLESGFRHDVFGVEHANIFSNKAYLDTKKRGITRAPTDRWTKCRTSVNVSVDFLIYIGWIP